VADAEPIRNGTEEGARDGRRILPRGRPVPVARRPEAQLAARCTAERQACPANPLLSRQVRLGSDGCSHAGAHLRGATQTGTANRVAGRGTARPAGGGLSRDNVAFSGCRRNGVGIAARRW